MNDNAANAFLNDAKKSVVDSTFRPIPCIPGQKIPSSSFGAIKLHGFVHLGPGISTKRGRVDNDDDDDLYAITSGILKYKAPNVYWIESNMKYYSAQGMKSITYLH